MISREETFELLAGSYEANLIPVVLEKLGLDPNADEFPEDKIEQATNVFITAEDLANGVKALPQAEQETAIAVRRESAIAHQTLLEQNISIPGDVLMLIAQSVIKRSKKEANALKELYKQSFLNELQGGQQDLSRDLLGALTQESTLEANLQKLIQASAPKSQAVDVTAYLEEVRQEREAEQQRKQIKQQESQKLLAAKKPVIDVEAFLAEVSEW